MGRVRHGRGGEPWAWRGGSWAHAILRWVLTAGALGATGSISCGCSSALLKVRSAIRHCGRMEHRVARTRFWRAVSMATVARIGMCGSRELILEPRGGSCDRRIGS
jgi:hypothetical protein